MLKGDTPKVAKILLQKVVKFYKRLKNSANLLNKSVLNLATLLIWRRFFKRRVNWFSRTGPS